jgi:hypothetical protein
MFFENETKACLKIHKKNYFYNLESLCDDKWNDWCNRFFLVFLIIFSGIFYFMNHIHSFYMISMFTINTKLIFVFHYFANFMFFENEIKVCSKIYKKNYFCNLESLCYDM